MSQRSRTQVALDLSMLKIMVVDDNAYMCDIVRRLLNSMQIKDVLIARDAETALTMMRTTLPDVLIVDLEMGRVDGLAFVRQLRSSERTAEKEIKILLLTAHTEVDKVMAARDSGVHDVLAKPISFKTLYDRLQSVVIDDRPFVEVEHYTGPCRRRKPTPLDLKVERRKTKRQKQEAST